MIIMVSMIIMVNMIIMISMISRVNMIIIQIHASSSPSMSSDVDKSDW